MFLCFLFCPTLSTLIQVFNVPYLRIMQWSFNWSGLQFSLSQYMLHSATESYEYITFITFYEKILCDFFLPTR